MGHKQKQENNQFLVIGYIYPTTAAQFLYRYRRV